MPVIAYRKVDHEIVRQLQMIVGEGRVLTDADVIEPYAHDEVAGLRGAPEVVVRATTAAQVSAILQLAQRERVPVTPRGAGYGLSGGAAVDALIVG